MFEGVGGVFRELVAEAPPPPRGRTATPLSSRLVWAVCLLSTGCGSTLYLAMKATSPRTPAEVFQCVKDQLAVLDYEQNSIDLKRLRLTARKSDVETHVSDTRLQKNFNLLSIEVRKTADGGAQLSVQAHSFERVSTGGGPWQTEIEASPAVKTAAQALLDACGK